MCLDVFEATKLRVIYSSVTFGIGKFDFWHCPNREDGDLRKVNSAFTIKREPHKGSQLALL